MATVRNLACLAFRPEALDVHALAHAVILVLTNKMVKPKTPQLKSL